MTITSDTVEDYNPLDETTRRNPYPAYQRLRAAGRPLWSNRLDCWIVPGYHDCVRILRDHDTFAADWRRAGDNVPESELTMQLMDPPEQRTIYRAVVEAFRRVDGELAGRTAAALAARLLDELGGGAVDLVSGFTEPLAWQFITKTLGLPPADLTQVQPLAEAITRAMDGGLDPSVIGPGEQARREMSQLLDSWLPDMPPDRPLGHLLRRATEMGVPRHITLNSMRAFVLSGYTSLPAALGNCLLVLASTGHETDDWHPDALATTTQELLRYDSPFQGTSRACVKDTVMSGAKIARGDAMLLLFGSANRDPAQFESPDIIRPRRSPNPHLAFGRGIHTCTGATWASVLVTQVLEELLVRRARSLHLIGEVTYRPYSTLRCLARLKMELKSR